MFCYSLSLCQKKILSNKLDGVTFVTVTNVTPSILDVKEIFMSRTGLPRDDNLFYDITTLSETPGIRSKANLSYIRSALKEPETEVVSVTVNDTGIYQHLYRKITGLPPYADIRLRHITGRHAENIIVWVPLAWNNRFMGTGGGGTGTGGEQYITVPDNTSRGQTLPKALLNGFACATTDAGNGKRQWAVEKGSFDWERYENWRSRSTHFMTVIGKRVTELLHDRPVYYSYFHGGSGGGRQAMVEAQEWGTDYDGIWASCPAINWTKFLTEGYWPLAVMNDAGHTLKAEKLMQATKAVRESVGGEDVFYRMRDRVDFNPQLLIGENGFTATDVDIVRQLWEGPRRNSGEFLWYGFRPGVQFWNVNIPVGGFYYQLLTKRVRPFFLCRHHFCWVMENEHFKEYDLSRERYEELFDRSVSKFASAAADKNDLHTFREYGGKLLIDHGTADPLIPVDGTLDYWKKVENREEFLRLYITPGDGHGTCNYHGPGLTESTGMKALIDWRERGKEPGTLPAIRVDRKGSIVERGTAEPYREG